MSQSQTMRAITHTLLILLPLCLCSSVAMAQTAHSRQDVEETAASSGPEISLGARIGGYGFRQLNESQDSVNWENCRMNGVGVFGALDFSNQFFGELSLDFYHATGPTLAQGIDRLSLHGVVSGGYRLLPGAIISPNVHVGGGMEWTKVEVYGIESQKLAPVGFAGIGGEINVARFHFGLNIRANAMQLPVYDWEAGQNLSDEVSYETEVSGQMLFSVRYTL